MTRISCDKILIANRGEICVRICRAARELSIPSIAIYAYEDRYSDHHQAADEAYLLGEAGEFGPRDAYMNIPRILKIAKAHGATMIHPGYGFLAEDSNFARAVEQAGLKFIGPPSNVLDAFGDKILARNVATECCVPTIPGLDKPVSEALDVDEFGTQHGFPIIIKASHGGGGRGQRVVHAQNRHNIAQILHEARAEAKDSFGVDTVFVEKFLPSPKHIEVQILADEHGNVIHLLDRDCTIQRKHQKIIEMAPAISVSQNLRQKMQDAAVRLARHINYRNAATVEFLVQDDDVYFIEVNPRIQVEHTVTEEILGIDLIQAQIRIAQGASLCDPVLNIPTKPEARGVALQCRITTEMPWMNFLPSCGTITHCEISSGPGVRIDGYNLFAGAEVTPHYDPMLFKCIAFGRGLEEACAKMLSTLNTSRIDGIETNMALLKQILQDPWFTEQRFFTRTLDDGFVSGEARNPTNSVTPHKLLSFLAETLVNGVQVQGQIGKPESLQQLELPRLKTKSSDHRGWRSVLFADGTKAFASQVRKHPRVLLTDTTWRDAQQSLLATRVRTVDLANIAPATNIAYGKAYSLECWGGATFDVALRFLHEDPWKRLSTLRRLVPDVPFQMLLRSVSGLAYSAVPPNFLRHFVSQAVEHGMDIIRVFDSLNDMTNLSVAIEACLAAGAVVEAAILYTGDMLDPMCKYSLPYYLDLVDKLVATGAHVIAIKSMSGVWKPEAARRLVSGIRGRHRDIPIHVHTHDAAGTGVATMLAAVEAGADIIDGATDSISGTTSQPAMSALVAGLEGRADAAEIDMEDIRAVDGYWGALRLLYAGFDARLSGADPDIYLHEIPGGQLTNLMFQARALGLGSQWDQTKAAFVAANRLLGDIIKATPTSKAVGDLAQFMVNFDLSHDDVLAHADTLDFPDSVLDFFHGHMGTPFDGYPEPLRTQVLARAKAMGTSVAARSPVAASADSVDLVVVRERLVRQYGSSITEADVCSHMMFPDVFSGYRAHLARFGDVSWLPTQLLLAPLEVGKPVTCTTPDNRNLDIELVAVQPVGQEEDASPDRTLLFRVNGRYHQVTVRDVSVQSRNNRRQADPAVPSQIGSPFSGVVSAIFKEQGSRVAKGDVILALSAMKMVINISAPSTGILGGMDGAVGDAVEKGDLLFEVS